MVTYNCVVGCRGDLSCIRKEASNILWKICDEKYKFNVKQDTLDVCS